MRVCVRVWEDIKDIAPVLLMRTHMLNSFFIKTNRPHGQAHIAHSSVRVHVFKCVCVCLSVV